MELTIGTKLHGFTVTNIRPVPDKDAVMVEMLYEKTGTELVWVKSAEVNKLFPSYKYIGKIIIRENEFIKTTTSKIKRNEPENRNEK